MLVNNAGITKDVPLHKMKPEQWSVVINTNLNSLFNMTRPVIEGMRERGWGRVINISSINGQKGQFGQTNYCAAKSGDIGFTKALAHESAGKGITVNIIAPGYIATDMVKAVPEEIIKTKVLPHIPVGRLGEPEEIARCVLFLASENAAFITGTTISINASEMYSALQTKIADGQENPLAAIWNTKIYEVQKYLALTGHMWDGYWPLVNKAAWTALPKDMQAIAAKHLNQGAVDQRADLEKLNVDLRKDLEGKGMVFNEVDKPKFRDQLRKAGFYKEWRDRFGEPNWKLLEKATGTEL